MRYLLLVAALVSSTQTAAPLVPDPPMKCSSCEEWNQPRAPFKVFGNTWFVGTAGLSAVLIASDDGHILLDGALTQSAPLIDANIKALGFRTEDVRLILNSHEHYDHAGGIAALQRASGAVVVASPPGARALRQGFPLPEDPQHESGQQLPMPVVAKVQTVDDWETLRMGSLAITAHHTPGHTPGATTWTWRSCEGTRCLDMVYADSLSPVSDDRYRFSDHPEVVARFRESIARVESLPCDVLLAPHPSAVSLDEKLKRRTSDTDRAPLIDANACAAYAAGARKRLEQRLATEQKAPRPRS